MIRHCLKIRARKELRSRRRKSNLQLGNFLQREPRGLAPKLGAQGPSNEVPRAEVLWVIYTVSAGFLGGWRGCCRVRELCSRHCRDRQPMPGKAYSCGWMPGLRAPVADRSEGAKLSGHAHGVFHAPPRSQRPCSAAINLWPARQESVLYFHDGVLKPSCMRKVFEQPLQPRKHKVHDGPYMAVSPNLVLGCLCFAGSSKHLRNQITQPEPHDPYCPNVPRLRRWLEHFRIHLIH